MAPVAAAISGNASGAMKSKIQSIAWPGPAMKPSSDIDLFTTTLPVLVLDSLTVFLRRIWDDAVIRSGACLAAILVIPLALHLRRHRWLYGHQYSQAGRHRPGESDAGRQFAEVSRG